MINTLLAMVLHPGYVCCMDRKRTNDGGGLGGAAERRSGAAFAGALCEDEPTGFVSDEPLYPLSRPRRRTGPHLAKSPLPMPNQPVSKGSRRKQDQVRTRDIKKRPRRVKKQSGAQTANLGPSVPAWPSCSKTELTPTKRNHRPTA